MALVALRKESVDRNEYIRAGTGILNVALRKESVDRNVKCQVQNSITGAVALRKETVDRNSDRTHGTALPRAGSLSARRAWIEMDWASVISAMTSSLSARRAWIEISTQCRL